LFLGATRMLAFEEHIKIKSRIIRQQTDDAGYFAHNVQLTNRRPSVKKHAVIELKKQIILW